MASGTQTNWCGQYVSFTHSVPLHKADRVPHTEYGPVPCFRGKQPCKARDLLAPMNQLRVGAHKQFTEPTGPFLLIDDGKYIDHFLSNSKRKATVLDFTQDSFNPLSKPSYQKALNFVEIRKAIFPAGENTLTKQDSNHILLDALLTRPRNFTRLLELLYPRDQKDNARRDVYQNIEELLWSPVLKNVFLNKQTFTVRGILLARLDPTKIAWRDCFVLGQFLVEQYQGQVWIPDFGLYGRPHHLSLIDQDRLIAGVNSLSEVSDDLRTRLLQIDDKQGNHCTAEDAETLADYSGFARHSDEWTWQVKGMVK